MLKVANKWPADENRVGRTLKEKLLKSIPEKFKKNRDVRNKEEIKDMILDGTRQFTALKTIFDGKFSKMVRKQSSFFLQSFDAFCNSLS